MTDYVHDQMLLADATAFTRAPNSTTTVYDANDASNSTPLVLKDLNGLPMSNPMTSSADAFTPSFVTTSPQVKLVGGGLEVLSQSYQGVAAAAAASASSADLSRVAAEAAAALVAAPADIAIAAAIEGGGTSTRAALNATFAPVTFFVDLFPGSDADKWQAAINASVAFASAATIQGGARTYRFNKMVSVRDLRNVTIRGYGNGRTVLTVAPGTGELQHLFYNPVSGGGAVTNLVFEDFDIHGGLVSAPSGMSRSGRVFGADKIDTPIRINGNLVPGETGAADVNGVTMQRVNVYGCEDLPVSFRGSKQVVLKDCRFERTMDAGLTWCEGVTVTNNISLWSADNGFSISRGCTDIVVSDNRVFGAWYWGIWLAGFDVNEGPSGFTCTGNKLTHLGYGGITLDQGGRNGTITGNTITDCLRGGEGTAVYGIGIYLRGNPGATPTWCENVIVAGNTIIDAARGGILVRQYSRGIKIGPNLIINPGTEKNESDAVISSSDGFQNFGVSVPVSGTEVADGLFGAIDIASNEIIDNRPTPYMNFGTFIGAGLDLIVSRRGNRWEGSRSAYSEYELSATLLALTVGRNAATDSQFKINGASGSTRALLFQTAGDNRAGFRFLSGNPTQLFLTTYTDAGTANDIAYMDRQWHRLVFVNAPKLPPYASGGRPSATNLGAGSMIYDTTLKKPLWSNGTAWTDATGTVV